jgi:hypothetical protein
MLSSRRPPRQLRQPFRVRCDRIFSVWPRLIRACSYTMTHVAVGRCRFASERATGPCLRFSCPSYGCMSAILTLAPRNFIPSVVLERPPHPPSTLDAPNSQFVHVKLSGISAAKSKRQSPTDAEGIGKGKSGSSVSPVMARRESDASTCPVSAHLELLFQPRVNQVYPKTACSSSARRLNELPAL